MFDLEREALIASGLIGEKEIRAYQAKLDFLSQEHIPWGKPDATPMQTARMVFDSLWKDRLKRYNKDGPFRLNEVIDAQLGRTNQPVGNCLGLTIIYSCLLKRAGILFRGLYLENAFEAGPHVLSFLRIDHIEIDVENILASGFDYKGHKNNPHRVEWGDEELVADIYQSCGTEFFQKEQFLKALRNYDLALKLYPGYEKAQLNKAILLDRRLISE